MTNTTPHDAVNHPSHYTQYPVEVIELTRHMTFNRGNAVKYVARAGFKGGPEKELEDIDKAIWYLKDERTQLEMKLKKKSEAKPKTTTEQTINMFINTSSVSPSASDPKHITDAVYHELNKTGGAKG